MLLDTVTNHDLQTQGITSQSFKIETNAITFQLLTANLYKNPIASIIRELTSNAWDAHVDAGTTETPIEITLPNSFSDEFIIKDFGTGLSVNDVFEIYTVLFRSTRRNSNDFFGGKGLGCKTPFAYTDTFIVESRFQGILYTYSMFLNEERIPSVALIAETPTDEPNGLTVRMAAKPTDHYLFKTAAERQLILFPSLKINLNRHPIASQYSNKYGLIGKHPTLENCFYIRIGHILYKIDIKEADIPAQCLTTYYFYRLTYAIILNGSIGQLDITPNREDLNYTPKTKAVLHTILAKFKAQFIDDVVNLINNAATPKEANKTTLSHITVIKSLSWDNDIKNKKLAHNFNSFTDNTEEPLPNIITKFGRLYKKRLTYVFSWHDYISLNLLEPLYITVIEPKPNQLS